MKQILTITALLFVLIPTMAQSNLEKYISTKTYINSGNEYREQMQYYNDFGEMIKSVQQQATPKHKNMTTKITYNGLGEVVKKHLPMPEDSEIYEQDPRTFEEIKQNVFSLVSTSPGADWVAHPSQISYQTNTDQEVKYLTATADNKLLVQYYYPTASLYKTVTTDQDGKSITRYTDKIGRIIMQREAKNVDTYYVYNDLGELVYVVPPLAVDELPYAGVLYENNNTLKKYAYIYKYNDRGNQIYKKLPGCEPIYLIYDKTDRLVLTQDGNQRKKKQMDGNKVRQNRKRSVQIRS